MATTDSRQPRAAAHRMRLPSLRGLYLLLAKRAFLSRFSDATRFLVMPLHSFLFMSPWACIDVVKFSHLLSPFTFYFLRKRRRFRSYRSMSPLCDDTLHLCCMADTAGFRRSAIRHYLHLHTASLLLQEFRFDIYICAAISAIIS